MPKEKKEKKFKIFTKSTVPLKKKIAVKLSRGYNDISFKGEVYNLITDKKYSSDVSNELVRDIVKDKKAYLTVRPKKKRLYAVHYKKKKTIELEKAVVLAKKHAKTDKKIRPDFVLNTLSKKEALKKKLNIKDIYKPLSSINYLVKKKLVTGKQIHMKKIRSLRSILKKSKGAIDSKVYRVIYKRIKGNNYANETILRTVLNKASLIQ